jgi:NodT family efflux transporter outer membrane factor (OMF) lipoprotein
MSHRAFFRAALPLGLGVILCACALGPDYKGPPAVGNDKAGFVRAPSQVSTEVPVTRWWTELNDSLLNDLVERALKSSPSVDVATARMREARASLASERAKELPSTGVSAAYLRAHGLTSALGAASEGGSSDTNVYAVGFDATWEIDLFGAHRRAVESASASLEGSRASLRDVFVSLSSEVAQAYVQLRDAQERVRLTERSIDIEKQLLDLMQRRRNGGTASDLDVARLGNQLDSTEASLGPLQAEVSEQMDKLALLVGGRPGSLDGELTTAAALPLPPERVAIGDPADLLRRRPDIASAERRLAADTATIGQDIAALFPKLTLLGDVGFTAASPRTLFNGSSLTYVAAPLLQWTPFDFGRNKAHIDQARAARDESEAEYRRTVLAALQDAESALDRFGRQRNTVQDYAKVQASAEQVYALTAVRLRGGTASTSDVLDADSKRVQAQMSYQQALAQLTTDFVAMQKSLGLGWSDSDG